MRVPQAPLTGVELRRFKSVGLPAVHAAIRGKAVDKKICR
jgi:hypothetical protein